MKNLFQYSAILIATVTLSGCSRNVPATTILNNDPQVQIYLDKKSLQDQCIKDAGQKAINSSQYWYQFTKQHGLEPKLADLLVQAEYQRENDNKDCIVRSLRTSPSTNPWKQ